MREIKDGAIFISDAHDNDIRKGFHNFLLKLQKQPQKPPQLFLMGDMFELLVGEVSYTKSLFKETIEIINTLSKEMEVLYFEGNHDFNLKDIFPNVKIYPIKNQPVSFSFNDKKILLSHGDFTQGSGYALYTLIIRTSFVLKLLNFIDSLIKNSISKKIIEKGKDKNICYKIKNFEDRIKQKLEKYDIGVTEIDFIGEGHHHQDRKFSFKSLKYINFSCFACDNSYYQITFKDGIKFIKIS